jgi:hypothetical protein
MMAIYWEIKEKPSASSAFTVTNIALLNFKKRRREEGILRQLTQRDALTNRQHRTKRAAVTVFNVATLKARREHYLSLSLSFAHFSQNDNGKRYAADTMRRKNFYS